MPERAYIAIGSNLESRRDYLIAGLSEVAAFPTTRIMAISSIYETPPIGPVEQPDFLNAVFAIDTSLTPEALLTAMLQAETKHLRQRQIHWGPRTLDLDLLLYGECILENPMLTLPHPHMTDRNFVLAPLCEIAPDLHHPTTGLPFTTHLAALTGPEACKVTDPLTWPATDNV